MNLPRSIASKLRDADWWMSNQGTIAGIFIAIGFLACVFYLAHLIFAAVFSVFATLGFSHWHWWMGFGIFGLTGVKCLDELKPRPRRRRQVRPVEASPHLRVIGGGNARVSAEDRWGRAA